MRNRFSLTIPTQQFKMSILSTAKPIHFATDAARKNYARGLNEAKARLAGHHKPTAQELEAASIARGRAEILKKFGSAFYAKTFGTAPPRAMAPAAKPSPAAASGTPKHYAKEAGPFSPRKLHVYTCRQWLAPLPA